MFKIKLFASKAAVLSFIFLSHVGFAANDNLPVDPSKSYRYHSSIKRTYNDKWPMYLQLEGKKGNFRDILRLSSLIPLWQDDNSMFFGDVRFMMDNRSDREANIALGYRHIIRDWSVCSDGIVLGAYISYDRRKSTLGSKYNQGTIGIEALGDYFRFSANYYAPQNKKTFIGNQFNPLIVNSGWNFIDNNLVFTYNTLLNFTENTEVTLKGYDVELRGKIPVTEVFNIWGGIGTYRFSRSEIHRNGPMAMLDVELINTLGLEGSRLSLGFEYRKDKGESAARYGLLKLTTPLATVGKGKSYPSLTGVEYEMTRFILRDVDIQTGVNSKPAKDQPLINGSGDNLIAIHVKTAPNLKGALIRSGYESSDLEKAMLGMATADSDKVFILLFGANAEDSPINITADSMNNAYTRIDESTVDVARKDKFKIMNSESSIFPFLENVVALGAYSHSLFAGYLIEESALSSALSDVHSVLAVNKKVFLDHIKVAKNSQGMFGGEVDASEINFDGPVQFSTEEEVRSGMALPAKVTAKSRVNSDNSVTPAYINLRAGNIQTQGKDIVATYTNNISGSTPKGRIVDLMGASELVIYAPQLSIHSDDHNVSDADHSKLRMIGFQSDVNSGSFIDNLKKPISKMAIKGTNMPDVSALEFTSTSTSSPFSISTSSGDELPITWVFDNASNIESQESED